MMIQNHQPGIIHNQRLVFRNANYSVLHQHTVYCLFAMPNVQRSTCDLESIPYEDNLNNQLHRTQSLTSWQPLSQSRNSISFVSLQEPTTRPCSKPAESTSHLKLHCLWELNFCIWKCRFETELQQASAVFNPRIIFY